MLESLQLIKLVADRGFTVCVSQLRLDDYSLQIYRRVEAIAKKGLIEIKEQQDSVYAFVEENDQIFFSAGRSLLALLHFCKTENLILVVDENETIANELAKAFSITTCSLIDFYKETINDDKYINFIMELKRESIIK